MTAVVIRGDARHLPLPDESVDCIVTSPPYFALRSYIDAGEHYDGQIGSEATLAEYLEALWACTREWMRVLKPEGSLWVNLGDKYVADNRGSGLDVKRGEAKHAPVGPAGFVGRETARQKSLMGIPWRYALGCIDQFGLILRAEVIWSKPNGLPESVQDRVRRSHEQWFHFVKQRRYYASVDEIREPHHDRNRPNGWKGRDGISAREAPITAAGITHRAFEHQNREYNPLGKLPGSVWSIPSEPLTVPPGLGVDHFAAFPIEWPRRLILGWSPPGICSACGQGRRPVVAKTVLDGATRPSAAAKPRDLQYELKGAPVPKTGYGSTGYVYANVTATITGYTCACTPYTDHPGSGERSPIESSRTLTTGRHGTPGQNSRPHQNNVGPWREYHFDQWTPAPTRPAVILDPFGGTGTTALVAHALGRVGVTVDMSADYSRLARWRTTDRGELAKAMRVPKPAPVLDGQLDMFAEMTP